MNLMIDNRQNKYNIADIEELMRNTVRKALEFEEISQECQISIIIVDNEQIKDINEEYRNIDRPTDVLSFPIQDWRRGSEGIIEPDMEYDIDLDTGEIVLGDIVVSLEKAYEQSEEYGHSFEREIAFLTVHGILHLLGYDHENENERIEMRKREEKILSLLKMIR